MATLLDKIVVIDIEATCWNKKTPSGMMSDIIEFGVCLLDVNSGEVSDNRGILVYPERSEISSFCTELTTITPELIINEAISFKEACSIIKREYLSRDRPWASFGAYDLKQIQRQCNDLNVTYPLGPCHINVKTLFALKYKLHQEEGMMNALKILNLEHEGIHHRGIDDSKNIAKILWDLIS